MGMKKTTVTMHGKPVSLAGTLPGIDRPVPDFTVLDNDLNEVSFNSLKGKPLVINSVVSLDTPVCDVQMRRFNQEAGDLPGDVQVLVISMDLPFAQKRWCGAADAKHVRALSDHRDASFGKASGLLIEGMRLLARAVLVVDAEGVLKYIELVPEISDEPDYQAAVHAIRRLS